MLIPRSVLTEAAAALRPSASGVSIAVVEADLDPVDLVRAGAAAFGTAAFTGAPNGRAVGGLGVAQQTTAAGPDRMAGLRPLLDDLPEGVSALVGFSYDPDGPRSEEWAGFPSAIAMVPQISVVREAGRSKLVLAVPPGVASASVLGSAASLRIPAPAEPPQAAETRLRSVPPVDEWRETVAEAVSAIEAGTVEKVVLARTVRVALGVPIAPFDLVALLRDRYPACRVFGWQSGEAAFVGASPELLISRAGRRFRTVALAGSAARSTTPDDDRRMADVLLASDKDRIEHSIVVDEIARRLRPHAEVLHLPPAPVVERYATIQHLATPIVGRTAAGASVLELADALHPTPAVGGHPGAESLVYQSKLEQIDRGWYAGGLGWADSSGDGELAVALRCGLIRGDSAVIYAGNGIVAGSDPEAEVEETRFKLRPLLDLLTGA